MATEALLGAREKLQRARNVRDEIFSSSRQDLADSMATQFSLHETRRRPAASRT